MKYSFLQKIKTEQSWEGLVAGVLLVLGVVFRLRQYLTGRSLWLDEAMLALNIVNRDFAGLFHSLDYDQGAPIGFLLVEKIFNVLFGEHEFVLRLFPFVVGVFSLGLFYLLLRRAASGIGLLTGLALFAAGPDLIYYSSEVKQYIVDVAVTIFMLYQTFPIIEGQAAEKRQYIFLGLAGVLALWFSHPALFVLAGIGIVLLFQALKRRERSEIISILILGAAWLANLGLVYFVSLRGLSQNTFLLDYWQENFMPLPPWSDWGWFGSVFRGILQNQTGIHVSAWLGFTLLFLGFLSLYNKNKWFAGVLLAIFAVALVASALRLYPLGGRLSLFLAPMLIVLISQSIGVLEHRLHPQYKFGRMIALLIGGYLLFSPISESISNFRSPKYFEHIRPSMTTLAANWQREDVLFVSNGAVPAFRFYADRYGLGSVSFQSSAASDYFEPADILPHIKSLDGKPRVWILLTHVYEKDDFNERDFILSYLDTIGNKKREFRSPGTSVYLFLYDLGP